MSKGEALLLDRQVMETPLGEIVVLAASSGELHAVEFTDCADRLDLLLNRRLGAGLWRIEAGQGAQAGCAALAAYFNGDVRAVDALSLALTGTPFQNRLWQALRAITPGETRSYGGMAGELGWAGKARAVGHANGANPFSIVVPCHRLIGANGDLTGYAGGLPRKRWLIDHEHHWASGQASC